MIEQTPYYAKKIKNNELINGPFGDLVIFLFVTVGLVFVGIANKK